MWLRWRGDFKGPNVPPIATLIFVAQACSWLQLSGAALLSPPDGAAVGLAANIRAWEPLRERPLKQVILAVALGPSYIPWPTTAQCLWKQLYWSPCGGRGPELLLVPKRSSDANARALTVIFSTKYFKKKHICNGLFHTRNYPITFVLSCVNQLGEMSPFSQYNIDLTLFELR